MNKILELSGNTNWGYNTNNDSMFTNSAFQLYNYVKRCGWEILTKIADSGDLQTVGMAFYYSACFINNNDIDINSVSAENSYYCLGKSLKLGNYFAAPKLYNLLKCDELNWNSKLLESKFNLAHPKDLFNPFNNYYIINYIPLVRFYIISEFYDIKSGKTRIPNDLIDYSDSLVSSDIKQMLNKMAYNEAISKGKEYFDMVHSKIEETLLNF